MATFSGPLFTGALERAVKRAIAETTEGAGTLGQRYVRDHDDDTFKHPTGVARSRVEISPLPPNVTRIRRTGIPYDWWLENGGTRSYMFPGYHAFRRTTPRLKRDVTKLLEVNIRRAIG